MHKFEMEPILLLDNMFLKNGILCKYLAGDLGDSKGQSPNKSYFLWCSIFLILVFTSNKHDSVWKEFIKAF